MPGLSPGQVFISYSRKDQDIVRRIVKFLRAQGINVWLDNEKLIPGTPIWEEEIEKALRATTAVIAVMSPDSKNSEWVRREISLADQNHKQIFPILVRGDEDSAITLRLITRQYVDMRENESVGLNTLYSALSNYLGELRTQASDDRSLGRIQSDRSQTNTSSDPDNKKLSRAESVWISFAWALAGALGGFMYSEYGPAVGGAIGGAIGSVIVAVTLPRRNASTAEKNMLWMILAWGISGAIGWYIGDALTEAAGLGIGYAIFAGLAIFATVRLQHLPSNWGSIIWIVIAWTISGMIGWSIGRYVHQSDLVDWSTGWALAYTLAWAIAGYVTVWQLRKMNT